MADNTHMYREIKNAMKDQIEAHFLSLDEQVDVYKTPHESIPRFPAVALELESRRKPKIGVGVKKLELDMIVWVYTDIYDLVEAEEECLRITEIVEDALESDLTLNGTAHRLSIDDQTDFGAVQVGSDSFLQGAKIRVNVMKRFN